MYQYESNETGIAITSTEHIINSRNLIIDKYHEIKRAHEEFEHLAKMMGFYLSYDTVCRDYHGEDAARKKIDCEYWSLLIKSKNVTATMTEKAKNEFLKKIQDNPPKFTMQEIESLRQNVARIYADSAEQTLKEVFSWLINCEYCGSTWKDKKRDNCQKIERQFRIGQSCVRWDSWFQSFRHYESWSSRSFEDLLTACYLLEGKGRPGYAETIRAIVSRTIEKDKKGDTIETDFFTLQFYKNGNCKVTWKPSKYDVLEKLNRFGSSGQLPDTMKKKYKPEHWQ